MRLLLLYPSCRPAQAVESIRRVRSTADRSGVDLKVALGANGSLEICRQAGADLLLWFGVVRFKPPYAAACAYLYRALLSRFSPSELDYVGYWSDDFYPRPDWLDPLRRTMQRGRRFILPNDMLLRGTRAAALPVVRVDWLSEHMGGLFWPPVYRYMVDVEPYLKAKQTGDFSYLPSCIVQHRHYFVGSRPQDAVDQHNRITDDDDEKLLYRRKADGFPVTWRGSDYDVPLSQGSVTLWEPAKIA